MRRLLAASWACSGSGHRVASSTLSSARIETFVTARNLSQSKLAVSLNGSLTKRVRLIEPRQQQPYGGSGCSPHGLVAAIVSQYDRLLSPLTRSTKITPGSAWLYVDVMIWSNSSRAFAVR